MKVKQRFVDLRARFGKDRRKLVRRGLLCVVLVLLVSHVWWLRAVGEFLVAEEPLSRADAAVILGGDHRLQRAGELLRDGTVREIWVLEREPTYAVSAGILRPDHVVEVEELERLGVPEHRIRVLTGGIRDIDDAARMIAAAVQDSPPSSVVILCERLRGRNVRRVMNDVLPEAPGPQIQVLGIPAADFDERSWWKSRTGWKETFYAVSQVVFTVVSGIDTEIEPFDWDPDAYEQSVIAKYGGAACHPHE